ncbi:MAG: lipoyl synthase [Methanomassiliicoccales archaeon]
MRMEKPPWLKVKAPSGESFERTKRVVSEHGLRTVCTSSRCPNVPECWGRGEATLMILGEVCTRNCAFCSVPTGRPEGVDPTEPERMAHMVQETDIRHLVVTSVARDDLEDQGASQFAAVARGVEDASVELLIPDMGARPDLLRAVVDSSPDVLGHNLETVRRLSPSVRDRRAGYDLSLEVLRTIKGIDPGIVTKSSLMLGLGERREEVLEAMDDMREAKVDLLTLGQYIRPKGCSLEVKEYLHPGRFEEYREEALDRGFHHVASAPLVRSSYRASEALDSIR